jgi:hypothetical protein
VDGIADHACILYKVGLSTQEIVFTFLSGE